MAKKKQQANAPKVAAADKPTTLKDLLSSEVLEKLKMQANELKAEEKQKKEAEEKQAADARKAEQNRLDNNFEHLLENSSMDWHKYK
ncbi:YqkE family protein [Paenibacillus pini]|uniref:DUF3886 domain-containing protein n=1 Tax=Paenibacillus pini JCM 16418 TaxID=1236976 RepID=W7YN72_9BACL|nr:YqkE family protein [Paenibacillus pini]GAF06076.1 hypothetical protein JCM16418_18 [Paenibacillus pini JCM 16418]